MTFLPVEVWTMVFSILLLCPTLPEHTDDVFLACGLLAQHCDALTTYIFTLKTASVCRQVSKAWKEMIDRRPSLASSDSCFQHATAVRMDMRPLACDRNYKCIVCHVMHKPQRRLPEPEIDLNKVRAWIDPEDVSDLTIPHILATFPSLTSLSVDWTESKYTLSQLSVDAPGLLNLRLTSYTRGASKRSAILDLPHLLLLSISALDYKKRIPFGLWNLPLLASLDITVYGASIEDPDQDDITTLLSTLGPHLCYLGHVRTSDHPAIYSTSMKHLPPTPNIWQLCPQLDTISLSYWGFRGCTPPPPEYPPLVVGLLDFKPGSFKKSRNYEAVITFGDQVKAWSRAISHFRFGVSWDVFFVWLDLYAQEWRVTCEVMKSIHLCKLAVHDIHDIPSHGYMRRLQEFEEREETRELYGGPSG